MGLATFPLEKLPLASLDLETTGLRPKTDRIVQIGITYPFDETVQLDVLVNPHIAIPESSSQIHHIYDTDIAEAPSLAAVFPRLREQVNNRIIIGYNIGFDLAVLQAEAARHGLEWHCTGALCIRQLAKVALGNQAMLMMGDLQALAYHYGVSQAQRHTALGDALMSARIYQKMIADLNAQSIMTLGDAWRAVSELDDDRLSHVRAGWIDVANTSQQVMPSQTIARIDPYPYQHRIFEIMQTKPLILPADYTLLEAAKQMKNDKLDCVFVGTKPEDVIGIVSERDIVHAMALPFSEVEKARDMQLGAIMSSPVITVRDKDFMHVGLGRIGHHDLRHLGVVNSDGALVGWLSLRELTRQRMTNVIVIGDKLSTASSEKEMKEALQELPYLAMSLLSDGVPAHVIAAVISHEYRSALRRAAVLAQDRLIKQGRPVPCDYVLLILGSAGRAESLLAADQDHAIIYEDTPTDPAIEKNWQDWFETLGGYISDILDAAGIPYCTGKVMSSNPQWCRSLSGWQKTITEWIRNERPQDLLNVDIFFDYEPVYGA